MGMYVDDFVPVSNNIEMMEAEKAALAKKFEVIDNGNINYFLKMVIEKNVH